MPKRSRSRRKILKSSSYGYRLRPVAERRALDDDDREVDKKRWSLVRCNVERKIVRDDGVTGKRGPYIFSMNWKIRAAIPIHGRNCKIVDHAKHVDRYAKWAT